MIPQINLLEDLPPPERQWLMSKHMVRIAIAFTIWLLIVHAFTRFQVSRSAKELAELTKAQQQISERVLALGAGSNTGLDVKTLQSAVQNLSAILEKKAGLRKALQKFNDGSSIGFSPYLTAFAQATIPGVWFTKIVIYDEGQEVALHGHALSSGLVPDYLDRLANVSPLFKAKKFKVLHISKPAEAKDPQEVIFEARTSEDTYTTQ